MLNYLSPTFFRRFLKIIFIGSQSTKTSKIINNLKTKSSKNYILAAIHPNFTASPQSLAPCSIPRFIASLYHILRHIEAMKRAKTLGLALLSSYQFFGSTFLLFLAFLIIF
ncbi:MAG: hypothetical protein ACI94Y_000344 [Maribacter sp.]|jgi:hypothetical protein